MSQPLTLTWYAVFVGAVDEEGNATMIKYLLDLDSKRGTNSKKTIPWCFE